MFPSSFTFCSGFEPTPWWIQHLFLVTSSDWQLPLLSYFCGDALCAGVSFSQPLGVCTHMKFVVQTYCGVLLLKYRPFSSRYISKLRCTCNCVLASNPMICVVESGKWSKNFNFPSKVLDSNTNVSLAKKIWRQILKFTSFLGKHDATAECLFRFF